MRRQWTPEEDARIRREYPTTVTAEIAALMHRSASSISQRARKLGIAKSVAFVAQVARERSSRPDHGGRAHRFVKGHAPANKGLRRPGWHRGRMKETQFKKGVMQGRAALVYKPVGAERVSKEGYLQRKINNDLPVQRRWRAVHLLAWESIHGPVPPGHAVAFKNGDRRDIRIENLELIDRAELARRNSVRNLPKPIVEALQLVGAINRQINRRAKTS